MNIHAMTTNGDHAAHDIKRRLTQDSSSMFG